MKLTASFSVVERFVMTLEGLFRAVAARRTLSVLAGRGTEVLAEALIRKSAWSSDADQHDRLLIRKAMTGIPRWRLSELWADIRTHQSKQTKTNFHQQRTWCSVLFGSGVPGGIRTHGPQIRN